MTPPPGAGPDRRPLRVLVLTSTFPDVPGDGTPSFVWDLAKAVAESDDFEITVVAPRSPNSGEKTQFPGIRVVRFGYGPRRFESFATTAIMPEVRAHHARGLLIPTFLLGLWAAARAELERRPYDLVHAHWIVPAGIIAGLLGKPYIITVHGTDAHTLNGPIFGRVKRWAAERASIVSPVSRSLGQLLENQRLPTSEPIPMGLDLHELLDSGSGPAKRDRRRLLFVGRLAKNKGVQQLVRALASVPDATLTIVGDGPERGDLERLVSRLNLGDRVTLTGKLTRDEVLTQLRTASAFIAPSVETTSGDAEGFSMVSAEAMASGTPLICTNICGITEYLTDGVDAIIVKQRNPDALASALRATLDDPVGAENRAARALEIAQQFLRIEVTSLKYEQLYKHVARGTSHADSRGAIPRRANEGMERF